jgi:hypothetical protein
MASIAADRARGADSEFITSLGDAVIGIHAHYQDQLEEVKRQVVESITHAAKGGAQSTLKKY